MKDKTKSYLYNSFVIGEGFTYLHLLLASIVSLITYVATTHSSWNVAVFISSIVLIGSIVVRLLISKKFETLRLRLERRTGILQDSWRGLRNVALRGKSIALILNKLSATDRMNVGRQVGESFYNEFVDTLQRDGVDYPNLDVERRLRMWAQYDSGSGMGSITVSVGSKIVPDIEVNVLNAFTTENGHKNCEYLQGYFAGFLSKFEGRSFMCNEVSCGAEHADRKCVFKASSG